ncbi:hypothetical protein FACS1894214_1460 [Planctomycetales bacterium]|nr:hypothetical protein FACS1894214_1460 [Planctomycetales bacterium]
MSAAVPPALTYEQMMEMFRQTDLKFQETRLQIQESDRQFQESNRAFEQYRQETEKQFKATDKKISALGDRIGELIELIVESGIVRKFREDGYEFTQYARHVEFKNKQLDESGEIDLFLENGDYVLAVEVKTKLSIDYVNDQLERMAKYRRYLDGKGDKRKIIAAIGGGVVPEHVQKFALQQGLFVVVQTGESIKVLKPQDGQLNVWLPN